MATTTDRARKVKHGSGNGATEVVRDQLETLAREGARQMLSQALTEEVDAFLGRGRYERLDEHRGYRNGSTPRRLTLGAVTIDLAVPRVRDVPADQAPFESKIVRKYQRRSDTIDETFMNLFVEGLATRDFEPALRLLVGQEAPLSPSTISRLTRQFKEQYAVFDRQDLSGHKFVYLWADGIYLKAGLGTEKACLMVLIFRGVPQHHPGHRGHQAPDRVARGLPREHRELGRSDSGLPQTWPERAGVLGRGWSVGPVGGGQRAESGFGSAALHESQDDERDRQAAAQGTLDVDAAIAGDLASEKREESSGPGSDDGPRSAGSGLRPGGGLSGG